VNELLDHAVASISEERLEQASNIVMLRASELAHHARTAHECLHPTVALSPHLSRRHRSPHSGASTGSRGTILNCSGLPFIAVVYAKHHDFP
jgi:hypothetical protein